MNNKKGISLIVLVITILVMIILAGVVIVSLQNDNPINKAKYAKMVDSAQSVRSAISQYAVTKQAESSDQTGETSLNLILDGDTTSTHAIYKAGYTKKLIVGDKPITAAENKKVKDLLGVDPTSLQGENGYFAVNPTTGASVYVVLKGYDKELVSPYPDGIQPKSVAEATGD